MAYISKTVDIDVDIELDDVLEFLDSATPHETAAILAKLSPASSTRAVVPHYVPVYMRGDAAQLIALGRLEELIDRLGVELIVEQLRTC